MPSPNSPQNIIAVDVGGTEIKATFFSSGEHGELIRVSTLRQEGPEVIVQRVVSLIKKMQDENPTAAAVGIAVAGQIDEEAGVAEWSENLGWDHVPFRKLIEEATGLPVGVGHDVRTGGLAEQHFGQLAGIRDGLFVPIGTGISGAMVIQGALNTHKLAGEIGHLDVGSNRACPCGSSGCLETVSSGASIAKIYEEKSGVAVSGAAEVFQLSLQGDTHAHDTWHKAMNYLSHALKSYISLLSPSVIVLGGGVSKAGDGLVVPVKTELKRLLTWQEMPEITTSSLGDLATVKGAGLLGQRAHENFLAKKTKN